MKNFILILIAVFALNVVAPAATYSVETLTELSDKKPKHSKKRHKANKKRSKKRNKSYKKQSKKRNNKNGLVNRGCRGLKALPKTGR